MCSLRRIYVYNLNAVVICLEYFCSYVFSDTFVSCLNQSNNLIKCS